MLDDSTTFLPVSINSQQNAKILATLPADPTPLDFIKLYITEPVVDLIVSETNRYAAQYIASNVIPPHSPVNKWQPTNRNEIYTFLGLTVLMGIVYKPRLAMYWSGDELYETGIFGKTMARDRYLLILRFLHFVNNDNIDSNDPNRDRLAKIRQVLDLIRGQCGTVLQPGRDLCVDESLLLFKGRLAFKQFIRTKRARYGIKIFELCTHDGILLDFLVYHGMMSKELVDVRDKHMMISELIPLTLMKPFLNKGHRLFIDNYYTSPQLVEYFLEQGTKVVGTVRPNQRNFPRELADAEIQRGESKFALSTSGVLAVKYRANQDKANKQPKVVCLLSTDHANKVAASSKKDKDGNPVIKPTCVLDYNHSMGGVDLMDQQLQSLLVIRKAYKWYKKLFFRVILQCLLSGHKLYKLRGGTHDFLKFLHDVVTQLLTFSPRLTPTAPLLDSIARLTGRNHFPCKRAYVGQGSRRASKKKICRVCYIRGLRTEKGGPIETTWVCDRCPSVPGLCVEKGCFQMYHTKYDYSV